MSDNIITFNVPNTITVGMMGLIMGTMIALGMKAWAKVQGG